MSTYRLNILMAVCLAALMLPVEAVLVPHSAKLHRRLTFVAQAPPSNWASASLEDYQQYHFRYLALGCNLRKGQTFFDTCCHPRLKTENLKDIPLECNLDAESMVKALYILKSSDATGNITAGQEGEGKPVFIPNGTIRAIVASEGCNSSEVPTEAQLAQLSEISRQVVLLSNSSHFANDTHSFNYTMNSTDFGNLTNFLNSNITGMANITQFLPANLTRFFNNNMTNVTSCKPVKLATNQTDNSKFVAVPKELAIKAVTESVLPVAPTQLQAAVVDHSVGTKAAADDAAAAKAKKDADAASAKAKSDAESKAAADAKFAADAQAAADAKGAADAKAAAEAQAAADARGRAYEKAAADKAAAEAQAAADAKGRAYEKAAAEKAAAEQAANDKAAADKAAADKAAAEKPQPKPEKSTVSDVGSAVGNVLSGVSQVFGADGGAKATYFFQEGGIGACGTANSDSTPLVALPPGLYANGAHCGKDVMIVNTANGKSVTAKVQDMCPGCPSPTSLDMSTGAYDAIGAQETGVLPIQWGFI
ncbi:hypothetical protein PGT21_006708 [Puccinia graminis f. sp. tritici]|uniref:Uncharacterized protein n=1 Tax=Puccinia graminis f. sp. tritici TaxID=56615 RepID=A0A5B0M625_PUCGR|nr:hypothetical protein PGT21_006708 [Puccinia graminis f. sp. tritici]KAA1123114.1 hypothetical protein PGTUg99_009727 [Puccinia graminis f. sp. tritici]